jgi:hypothetical protein
MSEQTQTIGLGIAEIIGDKRAAILQLAEEHGAYNVRVFGSVARGEARPDSDVDLLISVREGVSIFRLVGLWLALKELLGREVDLVDDSSPEREFIGRAARGAVRL